VYQRHQKDYIKTNERTDNLDDTAPPKYNEICMIISI